LERQVLFKTRLIRSTDGNDYFRQKNLRQTRKKEKHQFQSFVIFLQNTQSFARIDSRIHIYGCNLNDLKMDKAEIPKISEAW
jgi:hypothetical protein